MDNILTIIGSLMEQHDLPALLIGGHAVTVLGHPRATYDVDLLIPRSSSNQWTTHLLPLGYLIFAANDNFLQLEPQPDWPLPAIDLMLVDPEVFGALQSDRVDHSPIPTPSVTSLIALKLHAIRQPSRNSDNQDWLDVLALIDAHKLTLDDAKFSAIVTKHGGRDAITRIRAHLDRRDQL